MKKGYYKNIFNSKRINGSASFGAADPFLIKVNGFYYLTCTKPNGLILMKSFDLIHWEDVNENGIVGIDSTLKSAYAPEIMYIDGYFYACASPSGNGHYLYRSESIEGPFVRISENFHELIDGSFFVDSDEEKYFLRASETGIVIKHVNDIENINDSLFDNYHYFSEGIIGNWTEGPYLIKRYGYYYLTFTGTHFLSDGYRVNYASGKNINNSDSLKHQDILLISTKKEFYGLGHSMNILGPNLDSYYIAYHNMCPNGVRYLNLSRLMFDKKGHMLVNGIKVENNFKIERPFFEVFVKENNYLSKEKFKENSFSIEYNFKSSSIELILGYEDEKHYQTISFDKGRNIVLTTYNEKLVSKKVIYSLKKGINFNNYHSLRIQYKNNRLALYLDLIELDDNIKVKLNSGKIGFANNELKEAYLAYSKYSFGNSDICECKVNQFYLDNMCKDKNKFYTSFFINEEGYYDFYTDNYESLELENILIDGKNYSINRKLNNKLLSLIYLKKGKHKIIFNNQKGKINKILYLINRQDAISLNKSNYLKYMEVNGSFLKVNDNIYFENDRNSLLTKFELEEFEVSTDLEIVGIPKKEEHVAGLIVDVNNYAKANRFEGVYSFQGYGLLVNKRYVYVVESNFYHSKVLKRIPISSSLKQINLKINKQISGLDFYINNQIIYRTKKCSKFIKGKIGLYMNHASVLFKSFNLSKKEEI